jgi:hypothetical protein
MSTSSRELDAVAIGKPNGASHAFNPGGGVDVAELEHEIVTGESYHVPCARLAGLWARYNVPLLDAHARLEQLFDAVFPPDRDARWRARRDDTLRIITDIYRKHGAATGADIDPASETGPPAGRKWPEPLGEAAYHGLIGRIVRVVEPHTEADPAAILFQLLTLIGCYLGNERWVLAESTRHAPSLFTLVIGRSATARKGTSYNRARQFIPADFIRGNTYGGLSSGEGLINAVRDPTTRKAKDKKTGIEEIVEDDPGIVDKRVTFIEEEFARVLRAAGRDDNILNAVIRQAWDGNSLSVLTRKSPLRATRPHIGIIGHITDFELREQLTDRDVVNGFANRFLMCCAKRARLLPLGGNENREALEVLASNLTHALDTTARGEIALDPVAQAMWQELYPEIARERVGFLGTLTARAPAQILRLSLIYALVDSGDRIGKAHLEAGLAVWTYAENSARYALHDRTGSRIGDAILAALSDAGSGGLDKTAIHQLFQRNVSAAAINSALELLEAAGLARKQRTQTGGRPREIWIAL